ncbi:MAG: NAD-dependent protein deacetylase [Gammaproteobacteria bacterium]
MSADVNIGRVTAVTGAGVSTASGIPDYRDADGQWKRQAPIQHRAFVESPAVRRRYWARSLVGWRHFGAAAPNAAHHALARLERMGRVHGIVTQNVDGLHQRAGSQHVIDLHGRLDGVECLACGETSTRDTFQTRLEATNPKWEVQTARIAPDGDADLGDADFSAFRVPDCGRCGGIMKPSVVFYGGALPAARRDEALAAVLSADAILVVGSSLMVWSAFRLVRAAAEHGIPIAAVNRGRTRADHLIALKCEAECGDALSAAIERLGQITVIRRTA